jgi:hypothetical protein
MIVDGFWFWFLFGLYYWFKFVGQFRCPLWATTLVLCGTTTLVLCGASTLVLCGQQPLSSVGNNPCPLWDSNPCPLWVTTLVLCGTITIILCGTITLILCGTHHPLWLPFRLIGWFGLLVKFWDESMWFLVKVARQPFGSCGLRGNPRSCPL